MCSAPGVGVGLAADSIELDYSGADPVAFVGAIEAVLSPRWVVWSGGAVAELVAGGLRVARSWDATVVHRLLVGGWESAPERIWAFVHDLPTVELPRPGQLDFLAPAGREPDDLEQPVRPDGHLRPDWTGGGWADAPQRLARWASLAAAVADRQQRLLGASDQPDRALFTARAESTAELLCVELAHDGLPLDRATAERIIAESVGPRPKTPAEADAARRARDQTVLAHVLGGAGLDLRNPAHVRSMLAREGFDLRDTRAWRLEEHRGHPLIDALLTWRKAERAATTYGYDWLDRHVSRRHADGTGDRLRGGWSSSDGAAGRMTASAGLHNLPTELRPAVAAEPGHVFVRADLGQIEPRVLAVLSADPALIRATRDDDLYAPVAERLGVERAAAKVAVLAAMYGQTSGAAGRALEGMARAFPVAMAFLDHAARAGEEGRDLRTRGGRLVRLGFGDEALDDRQARAADSARGRYARNAMVQGAAAELFKVWAVTARARLAPLGGRIVLCLHDELLVHAPRDLACEVAAAVEGALAEAADRWDPGGTVRFVADVSIIERWSDAK